MSEQTIGSKIAALIRGAILKQILKHKVQCVHGIVTLRLIVARPQINRRIVPRNKEDMAAVIYDIYPLLVTG